MMITQATWEYRTDLLKKPFVTARRRVDVLESFTLCLTDGEGHIGVGCASPTAAVTGDTPGSIRWAFEEALIPLLRGRDAEDDRLPALIADCMQHNTGAKAAADSALWSLRAAAAGKTLCAFLGGTPGILETDCTVSLGTPEETLTGIANAAGEGFRFVKIKLGAVDDALRLIPMLSRQNENRLIYRFDANQAWTAEETLRFARQCETEKIPVDFIEQPLPWWDLDGMEKVTKSTALRILADESANDLYQTERLLSRGACNCVSVKTAKCGGITPAQKILRACADAGVSCLMSCMMEGIPAIDAAASLAKAEAVAGCDLDVPFLLAKPLASAHRYERGRIAVR